MTDRTGAFRIAGAGARPARPENRFGLDYRAAAGLLGPPPCPIVDMHAHVYGRGAAAIYAEASACFGVRAVFTMTRLSEAQTTREVLGDRAHFIAFPDFRAADRRWAFTEGFLEDISAFHDRFGARIVKLWNAPRMFELFPGSEGADMIAFDSPWRLRHARLAQQLGMAIMVHVADPDTWFATRYADATKFPPKREHYVPFERLMERVPAAYIAAHMGGWPEDLGFLDGLLSRHDTLYLDTSATKWIVRELSRHPAGKVRDFLEKWSGRVLFGSDIVTTDEHLAPRPEAPGSVRHPMADLADSPQAAFDLYASRYFAQRLLLETDYRGESPIADPDLTMVDPTLTDPMPAPHLTGLALPAELLRTLYRDAAQAFLRAVGVVVAV